MRRENTDPPSNDQKCNTAKQRKNCVEAVELTFKNYGYLLISSGNPCTQRFQD